MKKIITILSVSLLVFAFVGTVSAAENWRLSGNYTITFTCTAGCGGNYVHTMNVSLYDNNDGTFSGTGYYNAAPSITWTVAGDVTGDTIEFSVDYDGSAYYVDADGTIAMDGAMSGTAVSASQAFNWVMSPKATFYRYAEITSPAVDLIVTDTLNLGAFMMDNDYDPVSWAVRKGTCAAAVNTVMGNVDGFNSPFNWAVDASNKYKYVFSASADVTLWAEGTYCFIFNPSEDAGESDIRMTEFFKVNWDEDNDGVYDNVDNCLGIANPDQADLDEDGVGDVCDDDADGDGYFSDVDCDDTVASCTDDCSTLAYRDADSDTFGNPAVSARACDAPVGYVADNTDCNDAVAAINPDATEVCNDIDDNCNGQIDEGGICEFRCFAPKTDTAYTLLGLGVNRLVYNGNSWITKNPKGKIVLLTLADTHNCGCEQILTWLHANLPESYGAMNGHWKYGCSQSAMQDFMRLADEIQGSEVFAATNSEAYFGSTASQPLYGDGPITFTWNPVTGNVTGGYLTQIVPPTTGTKYYDLITRGTVSSSGVVHLIFGRTNPDVYTFTFDGTLTVNFLSGFMDGPYLFTATGVVTP